MYRWDVDTRATAKKGQIMRKEWFSDYLTYPANAVTVVSERLNNEHFFILYLYGYKCEDIKDTRSTKASAGVYNKERLPRNKGIDSYRNKETVTVLTSHKSTMPHLPTTYSQTILKGRGVLKSIRFYKPKLPGKI